MDENHPAASTAPALDAAPWEPFPDIDLRQMLRLTDDTGMFQHALHLLPDPNHGYCIDDNARALIAALLHAQLRGDAEHVVPLQRYLGFVAYAFNAERGRFRNFMSYDRRWLEEVGSEDSHGRAVWSLGLTVQLARSDLVRDLAEQLFLNALPAARRDCRNLRPIAFILLGLDAFLKARPDHGEARELRDELAQQLFDVLQRNASDDWPWWEDFLTWGNGRLPHALLVSGHAMGRADMVDAALRSLRWCLDVQTAPQGHLSIIGNDGWFVRGKPKAQFDQQPLEAYTLAHACLAAAELTDDTQWADHAWRCYEWFRGRNDLGVPLYSKQTGGCQDGLMPSGANLNQGAESSLAYLLTVLELHRYRAARNGRVTVRPPQTLGYAIVGVSKFARFCLEQYEGVQNLRPVAVWNRTASKAHELAGQHDLKAYDQLEDMLRDPGVHLVHVATIPALHAQQALAALEQDKHVLCEKPLATDLLEAQRMMQAAVERDRVLSVNFMMRYSPIAEQVRQLVESQLLGAPLRGMVTNRAGDAGLPTDHWFWDEMHSGGIFVEHGVHFFDLIRSWLGEGQVVSAQQFYRPQTSLIDQVTCEVRYSSQTSVTYYHGFHQPSALDEQDIRLVFERGEVGVKGWVPQAVTVHALLDEARIEQLAGIFPNANIDTIRRFEGEQRVIQHRHQQRSIDRQIMLIAQSDEQDSQRLYGQALKALMQDMVQRIINPRHQPRVTAEDGRAALATALDARRLARETTP